MKQKGFTIGAGGGSDIFTINYKNSIGQVVGFVGAEVGSGVKVTDIYPAVVNTYTVQRLLAGSTPKCANN